MLKVDELMLGNWVRINSKPFQITQINNKSIPSEVGTYPYEEEDIYPIELTKDILINNGMETQYQYNFVMRFERLYNHACKFSMKFCNDAWCVYLNEPDDEQIHNAPNFSCTYVHELQNFFKIKKIDFNIKL